MKSLISSLKKDNNMTESNESESTPSTITASSSLGSLLAYMSPSKPQRKSQTTPPTLPPTSQNNNIKPNSSPATSKSLMLVAGLLLSSSTVLPSNTNISSNAEGGDISSRGMSPLNPRRVICFDESCCNEEPVDDHFVEESEEDEELESKKNEDDSCAAKWLDRLSNMEDEKLIQEADKFFASSISTTSGVYIVEDELGAVGVWKPEQEESPMIRNGFQPGDGAIREVAAYALDRNSGQFRAGVPPTVLYRNGSLQRFVNHKCDAEDVGTALFETENVHRIGLLDLRIFNSDRHPGNLLFDEDSNRLIPIDHGLTLPPLSHLAEAEFGWISWKQANEPFSDRTLSFLRDGIDLEADMKTLRELGIPESSIATMCVSTSVLKHCALELGMTLHDIASIFVRSNSDTPSVLELAVSETMKKYKVDTMNPMKIARDVVFRVDLQLRRIREERFLEAFQKGTNTANLWKKLGPAVRQ